jgi:hypothetical protein
MSEKREILSGDKEKVEAGLTASLRQKLISQCKGKLYSFADLPKVLRASIDVVNSRVKRRRINLNDGLALIPFLQSEKKRKTIAGLASESGAVRYDEMETSDWQRNPRYRKTLLLETFARIIEENLDKSPGELCRMLFDCEDRFRREDEECCDGELVDYRDFLKEIEFFELLRNAVTVEYLGNEPTVVLALVSLFGSKALDVIGIVK